MDRVCLSCKGEEPGSILIPKTSEKLDKIGWICNPSVIMGRLELEMREFQEATGPGSLVFMTVNNMSPCLKRLEGKKQELSFPLSLHLYGDVHTPKVTHLSTHRIKKGKRKGIQELN